MIKKYTYQDLVWIDAEFPTTEEIHSLMEEYNIHPLVGDELLSPSLKPKVDLYKDHIYLILHFPAFKTAHMHDTNQEVDFVIGKKFIITVRYDSIEALRKYSKMFEVNSILEKENMGDHAGFVFFNMIKKLYETLTYELDFIQNSLVKIEKEIFEGNEQKMVREISRMNRDLIDLKQTLLPHKEVLMSFEVSGDKFFGVDFTHYLRAITGEYYKTFNAIESNREFLKEMRETNDSLLSAKQNHIMQILTIVTFVTFPLTLFPFIFSMRTATMPIVGQPFDFWIIIGIMSITALIIYSFFKYKKWL